MITEESVTTSGKDEDHSMPAFGVSGQFMMTSEEKAIHTEDFNPRKIVALTLDDSLARLFECLTLEYSGSILLTPKWKNFRSQKLKFAEKTRINNAIWRSWHIQFQLGKRPLFCQFDNPLTEMAKPPKPMTLMVEGRYWKRKLEVVAAEYQKWRVFYKQMVEDKFQDIELRHQTEEILRLDQEISENLRERERERNSTIGDMGNQSFSDTRSPLSLVVSQALEMVDSCNLMESMVFSLPDTLFTSLEADNRRIAELSPGTFKDTADTVQPTLDTLQPSLEAMTPVLDDLIEQLEASMKGSELNWDFGSIEKNMELAMGFNQSATGQAQLETMDHSGHYNEPFRPLGSLPSSVIMTSTWPVQTRTLPSQAIFPGSLVSGREAITPVWTSSPDIQPGVIGIQTAGTEIPGLFAQANAAKPKAFTANPSTVMYSGVSSVPSSSSVTASRPYMPTSMMAYQNASPAAIRYTSAVASMSGRIPRNSSDSQLYSLSASDSQGHVPSSPIRPRAQTTVPVEVQAPNLVAQLKLTKPRHSLVEEKAKRPRIPRNKSAPGLASLEASAQLKKAPQAGGVRAKRLGRIPRNRSDSSLASLIRQSEQSGSRLKSESESGTEFVVDSSVNKSTATQSYTRQDQPLHVFTEHRLLRPDSVETMQEDVMQLATSVSTSGLSSSSCLPTVSAGGTGATSQLVNQMVTHLMSKGISVEEILNKLTTLVAAGAVSESSLVSQQASLVNNAPGAVQDPQSSQKATFTKGQFSPFYPNAPTVNSPSTIDTQSESSRVIPARSRRKPQTPRPSLKNVRTECTAVTEESSMRSTDDIIQNILSQNRQEFQAEGGGPACTQVAAFDPSNIRESTPLGSENRWSNTDNTSFFNQNPALGDRASPRTPSAPAQVTSQPLAIQNASAHVTFPAVFQGTSGEVMLQDGSTVDKQFPGLRPSGVSSSGFTLSMLTSTPPAMTMTVAQVSPTSRTVETTKPEGPAPAAFSSGNYKVEPDTQVRSRPLTKTLPKDQYMEHRRMVHVSAEQKRRGNIKMGFDQLIAMVPALASQGNNKISKAAVLRKSVDYILQLQRETENMKEEHDRLRKEVENLNSEISVCQQQLPATGVMVNRQDYNEMESLFNHYVKQRTAQNPKFWIFSVIMRPLFDAYSSTVTTANAEEFCRTVLSWLSQNCSLPKLRPSVLASLRELSKNTSILTDPSKLPEQARLAANALDQQSSAEGRPR